MDAARFWDFAASLRERHWAFWLLTGANLAGIGFGYYYYWDVGQFDPSSPYYQQGSLWAFVADSPNAVLLMQVSLCLWYFGRKRSAVLDSLAFVHMVYVGFWTTYLFSSYPDALGTFDWGGTNNILFFTHMGMPLEALLLVKDLRADRLGWGLFAGLAAWGAFNLWLDYGPPDLRPAPFVQIEPSFWIGCVGLMAWTLTLWLLAARPGRRPGEPDARS